MIKEKDYKQDYEEFWKDLVEVNGKLDKDAIMRELSDYSFMLEQVPLVYCEVTNSRISKPNTYAFEVIGQFNELYDRKDWYEDDLKDILDEEKTTAEEKLQEIKDYFNL
jgi:hypothetical protein